MEELGKSLAGPPLVGIEDGEEPERAVVRILGNSTPEEPFLKRPVTGEGFGIEGSVSQGHEDLISGEAGSEEKRDNLGYGNGIGDFLLRRGVTPDDSEEMAFPAEEGGTAVAQVDGEFQLDEGSSPDEDLGTEDPTGSDLEPLFLATDSQDLLTDHRPPILEEDFSRTAGDLEQSDIQLAVPNDHAALGAEPIGG